MTKTLQKDPEAIAQAELAEAERNMKAGQVAQDELVRLRAIALNKVQTFHWRRQSERQQAAEQERLVNLEKRKQEAKAERAKAFDYKLKLLSEDMVRQREAGNTNGIAALDVLIANTKRDRTLALA